MADIYQTDEAKAKAVADRDKKIELAEIQRREDLKEIVSLPAGKRFFKEFFKLTHMDSSTHIKSSDCYFMNGERNVGLRYYHRLKEFTPQILAEIFTELIMDKEEI